ncbi:MAG: DUF445 family protein [Pseudomonadota bacterium]|nr:DUF445 family protein [Pseudomonadota bacterium]
MWWIITRFLQRDAEGDPSSLEAHLGRLLADLGRKLATQPTVRADINHGMTKLLRTCVQAQKRKITRFIANQIWSWDIDQMNDVVDLNIGGALQYIRLNGALISWLAGLVLYAGERLLPPH